VSAVWDWQAATSERYEECVAARVAARVTIVLLYVCIANTLCESLYCFMCFPHLASFSLLSVLESKSSCSLSASAVPDGCASSATISDFTLFSRGESCWVCR